MNWEPTIEDVFVKHAAVTCQPCLHSASVASACAIVGAALGSASTWVYLRAYASHQERVLAVSHAECASETGIREPGGLPGSPCRDDYAPTDSLEQDKTSPSDDDGEMESTSTLGCLALGPGSPTLARDVDTGSVTGSPADSGDTSPGWEVGPVIWRGALTEVLQKAEYSGSRASLTPEDLLLEIAQDAPQRWNMADFHFVTHCNSLMHILEAHGDRRAQAGRIFIHRVKQQMAEHMHILNQSTQLAYHAREDKRKTYDHRNQQRQVQVANAFLVLMLSLGVCFTWCFRAYLLNLWFQAKRTAPSLPPVCQNSPMELRCALPVAKIAFKFGVILTESVPAISAILSVGTILFLFYRVLSVPFGVMSSYAAQGNMVLASALSVLLWYLSHCVVSAAAPKPEVFYSALSLWMGAFMVLLLSDWVWPGGLRDASAEAAEWRKRRQVWRAHPGLGQGSHWAPSPHLQEPLLGAGGRLMSTLDSLKVSRGIGLFLVNGILWGAPAVAVLGSMSSYAYMR